MERQQAKLDDILGTKYIAPCLFSQKGRLPFKYEPCRSCQGIGCESYIADSQQDKTSIVARNSGEKQSHTSLDGSAMVQDKTADTFHKKMSYGLIRQINDSGVVA